MKILHVSTDFPYVVGGKMSNYGGLGLCVLQLVENLRERGIEVDVLSRYSRKIESELVGGISRAPYIRLSKSRNWKLTHGITVIPSLIYMLLRKKYDIVHVHNPPAAFLTIPVAKMFGIKTILTMHGPWSDVRERFNWLAKIIENMSLKGADIVTFDSESLKNRYSNTRDGVAIQNAVDCEKFIASDRTTAREFFGLPTDGIIYLYSGRVVFGKDISMLRSAALENPDKYIVMTGMKVNSEDFEANNLRYMKSIPNNQMPVLYSACNGIILPTKAEGMSRALLEAMSCERGVLASDIPANREVVGNDGAGLIFRGSVAAAISDLTASDLDYMGYKGRERVLSNFSIKNRIDKFINTYEHIYKTT
jgi:glycosyltransferase involved in cell wall biosynthesis